MEDSSTEREKSPLQFTAYIYHSPMYESIAGIFSNKNDQEIFKLATLLVIENPLFFMQIIWQWLDQKIIYHCIYFYL